jgi:hypothetical protein
MMDCRQALQILEFDGGDAGGSLAEIYSAEERAAAEAHLESCPACARTVANRQDLARTIGRVMRAVPIPRGAQQRLLARLSELEIADADTDAGRTAVVPASASELNGLHSDGGEAGRNGQPSLSPAPSVKPARPIQVTGRVSRRRFLKRLVPLTACLAVALVGFFGVVWIFKGKDASLPSEWERLCGTKAKGLSLAPNVIAVYGFDIPNPRHTGAVRGLIAVIPRARIRKLPKADSLATASSLSEYLESRIGTDSVCVAWQQGDVVCVCLIQGPDSLSTLQSALQQPSA